MTAASRVPQLIATYTYITGNDKPAIKCKVLFFRRFEDLRSVLLTLVKRKKGRKEERGKRKMKESEKKKREREEKTAHQLFSLDKEKKPIS